MNLLNILLISGTHMICVYAIENTITLNESTYFHPTSIQLSWNDAQSYCKNRGGHLAHITREEIEVEVIKLLGADTKAWIGGHKTEMQYWSWAGQNTMANATGILSTKALQIQYNCAHIAITSVRSTMNHMLKMELRDTKSCDTPLKYMCQSKNCTITEENCQVVEGKLSKEAGWEEARELCEQEGFKLLELPPDILYLNHEQLYKSINSKLQSVNLTAELYWIGLQYLGWKWVSGDIITFSGSQIRHQSESKKCLKISQDKQWEPEDCETQMGFICETTNDGWIIYNQNKKENLTGIVAGAVVAVVVLLIIIAVVIIIVFRRKKGRNKEDSTHQHKSLDQENLHTYQDIRNSNPYQDIGDSNPYHDIRDSNICQDIRDSSPYQEVKVSHTDEGPYSYAAIPDRKSSELIQPYASSKELQKQKAQSGKQPDNYLVSKPETGPTSSDAEELMKKKKKGSKGAVPIYTLPDLTKKAKNKEGRYRDEDDVVMVENDLYTQRN